MTPEEDRARRLQLDLACTRFLAALERDDAEVMVGLWERAGGDPGLHAALDELHQGYLEEQQALAARDKKRR